jgi:hypothetical protein
MPHVVYSYWCRLLTRLSFVTVVIGLCVANLCFAAEGLSSVGVSPSIPSAISSEIYVKVRLDAPLRISKLKPGDQIPGKLLQDVYSGAAELFPASSEVHLVVDRMERRRRIPNDYWPWVIEAFTSRHRRCPVFRSARIVNSNGRETLLQVSVVSISNEVEIAPKTKKNTSTTNADPPKTRARLGPIITLAASIEASTNDSGSRALAGVPVTIPAGIEATVALLQDVGASKNHAGDFVRARLVEPVRLASSIILPEGTLFSGKVLRSQAPRTLSRSGSIYLTFTNLTIPGGRSSSITASIAGAEISERSHTVIDAEGQMHGERPGKAWMLLNAGVTAGIAKEVDDGTQLIVEALVSTATDASTAGAARIVSTCASAIFLLTRHGRDVVLPKYTQLKIAFDRPAEIRGANLGFPLDH